MTNDELRFPTEISFGDDDLEDVINFFYNGNLVHYMADKGLTFAQIDFVMQAIMDKIEDVAKQLDFHFNPEEYEDDEIYKDDEVEDDLYDMDAEEAELYREEDDD